MARQKELVPLDCVTGLYAVVTEQGLVEEQEWRLLRQYQPDLLAGIMPGGLLDGCACDLGVEELVELAECANFKKFLVFDMQFEDFLNGEDDFEEGQRVQPDVFDESRAFIRLRKFYGGGGRLVAVKNSEDDGWNCVEITLLTVADGGGNRFRAAP